jgi:hypothetical protein
MDDQNSLPPEKSRWTESEWWLTVGTIVVGLLVKLGVLTPDQQSAGLDIIKDLGSLVMILAPVLGWQFFRSKRKMASHRDERKLKEVEILSKRSIVMDGKAVRPKPTLQPPVMS